MFATLLTVTLFAASAIQGAVAFSMATPQLAQCQNAPLAWDATTGPYNLVVMSASDPCGQPLVDLGDHDGNTIHWVVTLPADTQIVFSVEDSTGDDAWTGTVTVGPSDDTSCLPADLLASLSASSATPSSTPSAGGATTQTVAATHVATPTPSVTPVGAANAGLDPLDNSSASAGFLSSQFSLSAVVLSAAAVFFAL